MGRIQNATTQIIGAPQKIPTRLQDLNVSWIYIQMQDGLTQSFSHEVQTLWICFHIWSLYRENFRSQVEVGAEATILLVGLILWT